MKTVVRGPTLVMANWEVEVAIGILTDLVRLVRCKCTSAAWDEDLILSTEKEGSFNNRWHYRENHEGGATRKGEAIKLAYPRPQINDSRCLAPSDKHKSGVMTPCHFAS